MINKIIKIASLITVRIHSGLSTHIQDQVITFKSFKAIKIQVSKPPKVIPLAMVDLESFIVSPSIKLIVNTESITSQLSVITFLT